MQNIGSFVLDDDDERIRGLVNALTTHGVAGVARFICRPETKTVIGERCDCSEFQVDYGEFERLFVRPAMMASVGDDLANRYDDQPTDDELLAARILAYDMTSRLADDASVECFLVDGAGDVVVQINKDGTRRALPIRGFVRLFIPSV